MATYNPDGYMVVFAVDEEESLGHAEMILNYLKGNGLLSGRQAVILVANKTDLVRSRVISSNGERANAVGFHLSDWTKLQLRAGFLANTSTRPGKVRSCGLCSRGYVP